MLRIAIAEDQDAAAEQIETFLNRYAAEKSITMEHVRFRDGTEIVDWYRKKGARFDIILLDIEMPKMNGMDAAKLLRTMDRKVVLAFITNMAQFAIRGYEVEAMDFILKPVEYLPFSLRMDRMIARVKERTDVTITIHTADGMQRVKIGDIRYLETLNRILYYHCGKEVYATRVSMKEAQKQLTRGEFAKCNQCYLVNLAFVEGVEKDQVKVDGELLDMSRRNKTPFLEALTDYLGGIH